MSDKSSSRYNRLPWRLVDHYLPAWTAVFMVVIPMLLASKFVHPPPLPTTKQEASVKAEPLPPKWLADVSLGMLSFWLWALITNAHDGRLVRTSGRQQAENEEERKTELGAILFFAFLTMMAYLACNHPIPVWIAFAAATWSVASSLIILGVPE